MSRRRVPFAEQGAEQFGSVLVTALRVAADLREPPRVYGAANGWVCLGGALQVADRTRGTVPISAAHMDSAVRDTIWKGSVCGRIR